MNMGTIRLPGLIGLSRSLDMILTGRELHANEALEFGLVNRVTPTGTGKLYFLLILLTTMKLMKVGFFQSKYVTTFK